MTVTAARPSPTTAPVLGDGLSYRSRLAVIATVSLGVYVVATLLPDWPAGADMGATHYMGLLAANQPWNLLLFMAVPVVAAETIAITELVVLVSRNAHRRIRQINAYTGALAGLYFLGVFAYLLTHAVIPLTRDGAWRGTADLIAVGFYLLGLVPLYGMTLMETGIIGGALDEYGRRKLHAALVAVFLVVAHVAMIFGMLDPTVLGWHPGHVMPDGQHMPGMHM